LWVMHSESNCGREIQKSKQRFREYELHYIAEIRSVGIRIQYTRSLEIP
jgi:hypothetical protein